jgi:hypothetical protein
MVSRSSRGQLPGRHVGPRVSPLFIRIWRYPDRLDCLRTARGSVKAAAPNRPTLLDVLNRTVKLTRGYFEAMSHRVWLQLIPDTWTRAPKQI